MSAVLDSPGTGDAAAAAPAAPARTAALLAVVVAVLGSLVGPTGQLDQLLGAAPVRVAAGVVEQEVEGGWERVEVGAVVASGTRFRAVGDIATLEVPGGEVDVADGTRAVAGADLVVETGTAVVRSPQVAVGDGVVQAQGAGAWRYDATGRVGVYEGATLLRDATGREVLVRPLQEVGLRDGAVESDLRPYVYVGSDPFDRRHLADALGVDDYVGALARGLEADFGTAPQQPAFYTDFDGLDGQLLPLLGDVGFDRDGPRVGPPADVLVAAVVTEALVVDAGLAPADAATEVRTARLDGATWGLIAQARELDASHVRAAADRALARREQAVEQGTATPVIPSDDEAADGTDEDPDGTTDPGGPGGDGTDPDDGGDDPDDGDDGGEDPTDDGGPISDTLDDLGGDEVVPDPLEEPVDDVVDVVDDVLDGGSEDDGLVEDTTGNLGETVESSTGAVSDLLD